MLRRILRSPIRYAYKALKIVSPSGTWFDLMYALIDHIRSHRRVPRYRCPKLFNDHLFRLKTDGSLLDPVRQFITDKEHARHYIASMVGGEYTLRTLNVLRTAADVDRFVVNEVPCVIKPTHMSGPVLFCRSSADSLDRSLMKKWLRADYYRGSRESNYRYLRRKIIVEEFFPKDGNSVPLDYKVHCFYGAPRVIQVDAGRFCEHTRNFYDPDWHRLDLEWAHPAGSQDVERPRLLETMLMLAAKLSEPFSFVRVDMYTDDTQVKVGEITNCPEGAKGSMRSREMELMLGSMFSEICDL